MAMAIPKLLTIISCLSPERAIDGRVGQSILGRLRTDVKIDNRRA